MPKSPPGYGKCAAEEDDLPLRGGPRDQGQDFPTASPPTATTYGSPTKTGFRRYAAWWPKNFNDKSFVDIKAPYCIVPAHSFALSRSVEYFKIPRSVIGLCIGKSTYARCGIVVNITPLEPEWEGHLTLEISNTTPLPAKIYSNEGIAQLVFLGSDRECETSYKDRKGKYQAQRGVTLPRILKPR